MKRRHGFLKALGVLLAVSAVTFATGAAPQPIASEGVVPDTGQAGDCATAKPPKDGGFLCIDRQGSKALMEAKIAEHNAEAARSGSSERLPNLVLADEPGLASGMTTAAANGVCLTTGCWYRPNSTHATYTGKGWYRYYSNGVRKFEATADMWFQDSMSGMSDYIKPQCFQASRGIRQAVWQAERLYVSGDKQGGAPMSPTRALTSNSKSPAAKGAGISHCFDGFYLGAPKTAYQTVAHQHTWRDSYAGYGDVEFYMYAKSVKLKFAPDGGYYFEGTAENPVLVETPAGGGWRNV